MPLVFDKAAYKSERFLLVTNQSLKNLSTTLEHHL